MNPLKESKPKRSYKGEKWKTNSSNKKRLVEDFNKKCAYCDDSHNYSGGYDSYHVEHFAPKEKFPHLEFDYSNLLYSCSYCNISKSNKWVGSTYDECFIGNEGFIDPCTDEYYLHLSRSEDGSIIYQTELGKYIYYELKFYLRRHKILYTLEKIRLKNRLLRKKIEEKKLKGEDFTILDEVCKQLSVVFCEYYDFFIDCED